MWQCYNYVYIIIVDQLETSFATSAERATTYSGLGDHITTTSTLTTSYNQYHHNTTSVERATTYSGLGDHNITTTPTLTTSYNQYHHNITSTMSLTTSYSHSVNPHSTAVTPSLSTNSTTTTMDNNIIIGTSHSTSIAGLTVGVACSILAIGTLILILLAVLWTYNRRRSARRKQSFDVRSDPYPIHTMKEVIS